MKNMIIAAAALMSAVATTSLAQTTPSPEGETPAVATPDSQNPTAPVEGATASPKRKQRNGSKRPDIPRSAG